MVLGKRTREHSSDSNSNCFETLPSDKPISSSPLTTMHQDDVVSGTEAMLRRRKQPKTTPVSSSSNNKMTWTRDDELIILGSIVDYEKETKLSYNSDWDAFYGYVKDFIEAEFSKKQLVDKTRNLKKRFVGNKARCKGREGPSFTNNEDDEIFKMSMIIWDSTNNETECDSNEIVDQSKDVPCVDHELVDEDAPGVEPVNENMDHTKDASYVEHERVDENIDQAKDVPFVEDEPVDENIDQEKDVPFVEDERVDENVDQAKVLDLDKDAPCVEHELVNENMDLDQENDVPCVEHELVNENMDQEEAIIPDKEKSEEDNTVDEFCAMKDAVTDKEDKEKSEEDDEFGALKDALEATTIYQSIGKYQQSVLIENLRNIGAQRRKELADECKALLDEEMKLYAKKLILSAKLASAGDSC